MQQCRRSAWRGCSMTLLQDQRMYWWDQWSPLRQLQTPRTLRRRKSSEINESRDNTILMTYYGSQCWSHRWWGDWHQSDPQLRMSLCRLQSLWWPCLLSSRRRSGSPAWRKQLKEALHVEKKKINGNFHSISIFKKWQFFKFYFCNFRYCKNLEKTLKPKMGFSLCLRLIRILISYFPERNSGQRIGSFLIKWH